MNAKTMWAVFDRRGHLILWSVAAMRAKAQANAAECCMGYREYEQLGTNAARWKYLYRKGYRAAKVTVSRATQGQQP